MNMLLFKRRTKINLLGIDDPEFVTGNRDEGSVVKDAILKAKFEMLPNTFDVLLSHRPEFLTEYADEQLDLVLSVMLMEGKLDCHLLVG